MRYTEQVIVNKYKGHAKLTKHNCHKIVRWLRASSQAVLYAKGEMKQQSIETLRRTQFIDPTLVVALLHDQSESCMEDCLSLVYGQLV